MAQDASKKKRTQTVIDALNRARSMELHAIQQYMLQHYTLDDLDYGDLAKKVKKIAIDEMKHAERFAERVKELGGEPSGELADKVAKKQDVPTTFAFDADLEDNTLTVYNQLAQVCRDNGDVVSATLFEGIAGEEQEHYNEFDDVRNHIKELGASYLARMTGGAAD